MAKRKKRRITDEEIRRGLGEEFLESLERNQRRLAERLAERERQREAKQTAAPDC
jgi:hypothetical protein